MDDKGKKEFASQLLDLYKTIFVKPLGVKKLTLLEVAEHYNGIKNHDSIEKVKHILQKVLTKEQLYSCVKPSIATCLREIPAFKDDIKELFLDLGFLSFDGNNTLWVDSRVSSKPNPLYGVYEGETEEGVRPVTTGPFTNGLHLEVPVSNQFSVLGDITEPEVDYDRNHETVKPESPYQVKPEAVNADIMQVLKTLAETQSKMLEYVKPGSQRRPTENATLGSSRKPDENGDEEYYETDSSLAKSVSIKQSSETSDDEEEGPEGPEPEERPTSVHRSKRSPRPKTQTPNLDENKPSRKKSRYDKNPKNKSNCQKIKEKVKGKPKERSSSTSRLKFSPRPGSYGSDTDNDPNEEEIRSKRRPSSNMSNRSSKVSSGYSSKHSPERSKTDSSTDSGASDNNQEDKYIENEQRSSDEEPSEPEEAYKIQDNPFFINELVNRQKEVSGRESLRVRMGQSTRKMTIDEKLALQKENRAKGIDTRESKPSKGWLYQQTGLNNKGSVTQYQSKFQPKPLGQQKGMFNVKFPEKGFDEMTVQERRAYLENKRF